MRKVAMFVILECYALALALLHWQAGIRTDEAKYLLNIPYPHPPLGRFLLHLTNGWEYEEIFWRIIFATLVIQAVWLVWSIGRANHRFRLLLSVWWLISGGIVLQAGTIMMAPLTALVGLIFVAAARKQHSQTACFFLACLWLVSLFTAYQAVLYMPLLLALFLRARLSRTQIALYVLGPLLALFLYTLANPLALASMILVSHKDAGLSIAARLSLFLDVWLLAGTGIVSVIGTIGVALKRRLDLLFTFALVSLYIFFSNHPYYAVLLVPILIAGCSAIFEHIPVTSQRRFGVMISLAQLIALPMLFPPLTALLGERSIARSAIETVQTVLSPPARLLVVGPFGHEWQYESPYEIIRYSDSLIDLQADAVVCVRPCKEELTRGMRRLESAPVEAYSL